MTPPTTKTTSVDVKFYAHNATIPDPDVSAILIDSRSVFHVHSNHNVANTKMFVKVDSQSATSSNLKVIEVQTGQMTIGSANESDICHAVYDFQPSDHYALKMFVRKNDNTTLFAKFSHGDPSDASGNQNKDSYDFMYRADGGDIFDPSSNVTNVDEVENGSTLDIYCPLLEGDEGDSRVPHTLIFTFDEKDDYPYPNDSDNSEAIQSWSQSVDYDADGQYTLTDVELENDALYQVCVVGLYDDGHTVSHTLTYMVPVIERPVISDIIAYGLIDSSGNKFGSGDSTIDTVMDVTMQEDTTTKKINVASNSILFKLMKGNVTYYEVRVPTNQNGTYTILNSDLGNLLQANPTANTDGSYTFDVVAVLEYVNPNDVSDPSINIIKTSEPFEATFTHDINQLPIFNIENAWISAAVTTVGGQRMVDLTDPSSNSGYNVAPEFGIVGSFKKHAFYGSGISDGLFKDLDTVSTSHKFELTKYDADGATISTVPVTQLYQMLGTHASPTPQQTQQEYINLLNSTSVIDSSGGLYPNISKEELEGVSGTNQPPIYFWIPYSSGLYSQTDIVKVSIQIVSDGATVPDATFSADFLTVVHKVNRYEMSFGTDLEPTFTGSGSDGELTIPINNPITESGDYYLSSATFVSDLTSPNNTVLKSQENDGEFDIIVSNPSPRGVANPCTYQVYYSIVYYPIADPSGTMIRGPLSEEYEITLADEPTSDNFTISNYSYSTFHNDNISSFSFDISFNDVGDTGIDGVNVYFESDSDFVFVDSSGSFGSAVNTLFHLRNVPRSNGNYQQISHVLQSTPPLTSGVNDGVSITGNEEVSSEEVWKNYGAGRIVIEPYITHKVSSSDDEQVKIPDESERYDINNIPVISKVENILLAGGVLELHNDTTMFFDNALSMYDGVSTVSASYVLNLNSQDQSNAITSYDANTDMYVISLGESPSTYSLNIRVKVVAANDGTEYESELATLVFDSASVDVSNMTIDIRRNSNSSSLSVVRGEYTVSPPQASSYLNVTEISLVNNSDSNNTDPYSSNVDVLPFTSGSGSVQLTGSNVSPNTYDISYNLSTILHLQYRVEAGVDYTLQYSSESSSTTYESATGYIELKPELSNNVTNYTVAVRPEVTVLSTYLEFDSSSNMVLRVKVDAKGLESEGVQSVLFLLAQEGNYTDADDGSGGEGSQIVLSFTCDNVSETYEITSSADSLDNINQGEEATLTTEDNAGLTEGSGLSATWKLKAGSLDSSDESVLTFPALSSGSYGGFVDSKPISVVVVVSTRLGVDVDIQQCLPAP
jgi:hypothetical protein